MTTRTKEITPDQEAQCDYLADLMKRSLTFSWFCFFESASFVSVKNEAGARWNLLISPINWLNLLWIVFGIAFLVGLGLAVYYGREQDKLL